VLARRSVIIAMMFIVPFAERSVRFSYVSAANLVCLVFHGIMLPFEIHRENVLEMISLAFLTLMTVGLSTADVPFTRATNSGFASLVFLPMAFFIMFVVYIRYKLYLETRGPDFSTIAFTLGKKVPVSVAFTRGEPQKRLDQVMCVCDVCVCDVCVMCVCDVCV